MRLRGVLGLLRVLALGGWLTHVAGFACVFVAGFFLAALLRMFAHGWVFLMLGLLAVRHGWLLLLRCEMQSAASENSPENRQGRFRRAFTAS